MTQNSQKNTWKYFTCDKSNLKKKKIWVRVLPEQADVGGSEGARKKPSSHRHSLAPEAEGLVLSGQTWQKLFDTEGLKYPGLHAVWEGEKVCVGLNMTYESDKHRKEWMIKMQTIRLSLCYQPFPPDRKHLLWVTHNNRVFVPRGMNRDFPDDLPSLACFALRPNLRSHCQCQPDDSIKSIRWSDLPFPCEPLAHILWQLTFTVLPKEMAHWTLVQYCSGHFAT